MEETKGLIVKALGGFYYVKTPHSLLECRARGVFRKKDMTPYVGDNVTVELTGIDKGYVIEIDERKNYLIRPPVANLDRILMVVSTTEPAPNFFVLDRLIAISEYKNIEPVIIITKTDLQDGAFIKNTYEKSGFTVIEVCSKTGKGVEEVKKIISTGISAFCGNTGVGKSSLLNAVDENLTLATAEISKKLGRGRHTTRHVELFELSGGGYIADTPGFSAVETDRFETILKEDLQYCFREFAPYISDCKFTGCSHRTEKGCKVLEALKNEEIVKSRHDSYVQMYEKAKEIKEWEIKSKNV